MVLGSFITKIISSKQQLANIFTKPLPPDVFHGLRIKLSLWSRPQSRLKGTTKEDISGSDSSKEDSIRTVTMEIK